MATNTQGTKRSASVVLQERARKVKGKTAAVDTATLTQEHSWYDAAAHMSELQAFISSWTGLHDLHCLDLYGASMNIKEAWQRYGDSGAAYDIKSGGRSHDVTSRVGFMVLLELGLRLMPQGIVVAGPPCSLFVFLSKSVHQRTEARPWGQIKNSKVRLANQIIKNTVVFLRLMLERNVWCVLEQPANSWMFKIPVFRSLISDFRLRRVSLWLGTYGHDLPKPTHLVGNMPTLENMRRVCPTKGQRARKQFKKQYHYQNASGKVCGGKDLSSSACYPVRFCEALHLNWYHARKYRAISFGSKGTGLASVIHQ